MIIQLHFTIKEVGFFSLFWKNKKFQKSFATLIGVIDIFDDEKINIIQEFTALMYTVKKIVYLTALDSKLIPSCWKSLKEKMLRTIYNPYFTGNQHGSSVTQGQ